MCWPFPAVRCAGTMSCIDVVTRPWVLCACIYPETLPTRAHCPRSTADADLAFISRHRYGSPRSPPVRGLILEEVCYCLVCLHRVLLQQEVDLSLRHMRLDPIQHAYRVDTRPGLDMSRFLKVPQCCRSRKNGANANTDVWKRGENSGDEVLQLLQ